MEASPDLVESDNEAAPSVDTSAIRARRKKRAESAQTVNFSLQPEVRMFLTEQAREAGMDMTHYLQKLVDDHVVATAAADNPLSIRIQARRAFINRIVALAQEMDTAGDFDEHFILNVMKRAMDEPETAENYTRAVTQDPDNERRTARISASLNQQIGRLIKRAAGARSKRDDNKKIQRAQIQGEVLTSYTLLDKPAVDAA